MEKGKLGAGQGETLRRTKKWDWELSVWLDNDMGGAIVWPVRALKPLIWAGNPAPSLTGHVMVSKLCGLVSESLSIK